MKVEQESAPLDPEKLSRPNKFAANMPAEVLGDIYHLGAAMILHKGFYGAVFGREEKIGPAREFLQHGHNGRLEFASPSSENWRRVTSASTTNRRASYATKAVALKFAEDPVACRERLRAAWLPAYEETLYAAFNELYRAACWSAGLLEFKLSAPKVLVWSRIKDNDHRTMTAQAYRQIVMMLKDVGIIPICLGSNSLSFLSIFGELSGCIKLFEHWSAPCFEIDGIRRQLAFIDFLQRQCGAIGQIGIKSGSMDGPALLGMPTIYIEAESERLNSNKNVRMENWLGVVPNFARVQTSQFVSHTTPGSSLTDEELAQIYANVKALFFS